MRKLSMALVAAAGLTLLAGAAAAPAIAQVRLEIGVGPHSYYGNQGTYYGYNNRPYYAPYYYQPYYNPRPGIVYPYYNQYSNPYYRHTYPGIYLR
jgi:hypothetical protein